MTFSLHRLRCGSRALEVHLASVPGKKPQGKCRSDEGIQEAEALCRLTRGLPVGFATCSRDPSLRALLGGPDTRGEGRRQMGREIRKRARVQHSAVNARGPIISSL
ncbi:hypothetical protein Efla_004422 [Eimeria flavescens]